MPAAPPPHAPAGSPDRPASGGTPPSAQDAPATAPPSPGPCGEAARVARLRAEGLTLTVIAERLGLHRSTVRRYARLHGQRVS